MSDLISRSKAVDAIENLVASMSICLSLEECRGMQSMRERAVMAVKELPSAQSNRVRCAYCKKYDLHDHRCKHWNHGVSNVDWCSYAEAKDGSN